MYKYLMVASLLGLGKCGVIDTGSLGGLGGGGDWQQWQQQAAYGYAGQGLDDGQGHGSPDGSIGGDFHHGVSVVSTGGGDKGAVFDLTNHGGSDHQGSFGGSFVASSKYSAAGHGGDGGHGGGGSFKQGGGGGGYGVSEGTGFADHYSDVLGASESVGGYAAHTGGSLGGGEGLSAYHASFAGGAELGGGYH